MLRNIESSPYTKRIRAKLQQAELVDTMPTLTTNINELNAQYANMKEGIQGLRQTLYNAQEEIAQLRSEVASLREHTAPSYNPQSFQTPFQKSTTLSASTSVPPTTPNTKTIT